ncbi:ALP1-like protein isoform X1 [Tanacetum coccineum]
MKFKRVQESARKDIERAFGVLQGRWGIIQQPARSYHMNTIKRIMYRCMISHNMILEDQKFDISEYWHMYASPESDIQRTWVERCERQRRRNKEHRDRRVHKDLRHDIVEHLLRRAHTLENIAGIHAMQWQSQRERRPGQEVVDESIARYKRCTELITLVFSSNAGLGKIVARGILKFGLKMYIKKGFNGCYPGCVKPSMWWHLRLLDMFLIIKEQCCRFYQGEDTSDGAYDQLDVDYENMTVVQEATRPVILGYCYRSSQSSLMQLQIFKTP